MDVSQTLSQVISISVGEFGNILFVWEVMEGLQKLGPVLSELLTNKPVCVQISGESLKS